MTRNRRIKYPISVSDMWECGIKEPARAATLTGKATTNGGVSDEEIRTLS